MIRNAPHAALIVPGARLGSGQLELEPEPEPSQSGISIGSARPSLARLMKALGSARQADRSANTGSATASSGSGSRRNTTTKHLFQYLQGTRSWGIIYGKTPNPFPLFHAFADFDWAMSEGRQSISGFIVECASAPMAWSSKQQAIVALSSCEAEYLACTHCTHEVVWLGSLFIELCFSQGPTTLLCNNEGTVACTHNPHSHSQMKHIDIHTHFIHDCVNNHLINVHHIPGTENVANILTKPLNKIIHTKWLKCLQMDEGQGGVLEV